MSTTTTATSDATQPAIVYFDGVCGMCNWSVDFLMRRDRHRRLRYAPLQGTSAQHLREQLNLPSEELLSSLIYEDGTGHYRRSDAVWRILVKIGGLWGFVGRLLRLVPRPLRNWAYSWIAHRRYRFFGQKESCRVPTREERQLFLP